MKITCFHFLFIGCLLFVLSSCNGQFSSAKSYRTSQKISLQNQYLQPLQDTILKWIKEKNIPSMAVAVASKGTIIWLDAYGYANVEKKLLATPQTSYALGSLSKSISATGVMTLVENGDIDLEDFVNPLIAPDSLTSPRWNADAVRVWHLLNSSAGIPHGWSSYDINATSLPKNQLFSELLKRYGVVTFPPGEVHHYANYSFGVADLLMERVSKKPLEQFLQAALFQPLGMKNSHSEYLQALAHQFAIPYNSRTEALNPYQFYPNGGGGYFASAEDLIRYGLFHAKHFSPQQKVLSPANIDRMHRFEKSASKIFQLGWHNVGHALVSNGSITGANSHLVIVPSEDLVVVCLTNSSNQYADQLADKIINVMAPDLKPQMTYEKYMEEYETPYQATPKLAGKWSGTIYAHNIKLPIQLDFKPDGQITVQIGKETAKVLENVTFNRYNKLEAYFNGKVPVPEYDGKEEVFHNLHLVLIDNELVGHIAVRFSRDNNAFQYGVYIELRRE